MPKKSASTTPGAEEKQKKVPHDAGTELCKVIKEFFQHLTPLEACTMPSGKDKPRHDHVLLFDEDWGEFPAMPTDKIGMSIVSPEDRTKYHCAEDTLYIRGETEGWEGKYREGLSLGPEVIPDEVRPYIVHEREVKLYKWAKISARDYVVRKKMLLVASIIFEFEKAIRKESQFPRAKPLAEWNATRAQNVLSCDGNTSASMFRNFRAWGWFDHVKQHTADLLLFREQLIHRWESFLDKFRDEVAQLGRSVRMSSGRSDPMSWTHCGVLVPSDALERVNIANTQSMSFCEC